MRLGADQEPSRTIGINPEISIRRTKLTSNQLVLLVVYIASCISLNRVTQLTPLNYNKNNTQSTPLNNMNTEASLNKPTNPAHGLGLRGRVLARPSAGIETDFAKSFKSSDLQKHVCPD
jgi:hypothetical protein